jgi:hypothetical protein
MEIAVLEYKPASQKTNRLVDNFFPGTRTFTRIDFALVINKVDPASTSPVFPGLARCRPNGSGTQRH